MEYCLEVIKENDPSGFLQVGGELLTVALRGERERHCTAQGPGVTRQIWGSSTKDDVPSFSSHKMKGQPLITSGFAAGQKQNQARDISYSDQRAAADGGVSLKE